MVSNHRKAKIREDLQVKTGRFYNIFSSHKQQTMGSPGKIDVCLKIYDDVYWGMCAY